MEKRDSADFFAAQRNHTSLLSSTTSNRCSTGLGSGDCEAQRTHCRVHVCGMACYLAYTEVIKELAWSATTLRWAVAFKLYTVGTKGAKVCQENIPTRHYTTRLNP